MCHMIIQLLALRKSKQQVTLPSLTTTEPEGVSVLALVCSPAADAATVLPANIQLQPARVTCVVVFGSRCVGGYAALHANVGFVSCPSVFALLFDDALSASSIFSTYNGLYLHGF